jgi:hypothetical protein
MIAIYCSPYSLNNHQNGVNKIFCNAQIFNTKILIPKQNFIRKLVTFTITENAEKVRNALFEAGAGNIGNMVQFQF